MKSPALGRRRSLLFSLTAIAAVLVAPPLRAQAAPEAAAPEAPEPEPPPEAPEPQAPSEPAAPAPVPEAPAPAQPEAVPAEGEGAAPTAPTAAAPADETREPAAGAPIPEPPPAPAAAPPQFPLSVAGSFWSRYELRSGYAEHGLTHPRLHREGDYLVSRARLSVKTLPVDLGEGLMASATFVPQAAYTMGETGAPATIGDHPPVVLYEGFARVGGDTVQVDAGRFMMNYGDALVIGDLGWNESARSFNGARMHLTPGSSGAYLDLFATLISEGRSVTQEPISGDVYFWGAYAGLGPALGEGLELDLYFLGQSTARNEDVVLTNPDDATETIVGELEPAADLTLGARVKGKASLVDYRAEAGLQFGKSPVAPSFGSPDPEAASKFAYQADAELGINPMKNLRLAVEGVYASGNDPETEEQEGWNELYPTAHKFLGLADIIGGRTNILSAVFHLKYAPIESLTLNVDAHYFSRPEPPASGRSDGAVGSEIDTNLAYAFGAGASVRGMYAIFLPDEEYWEAQATSAEVAGDALHYFELQFGYDFK